MGSLMETIMGQLGGGAIEQIGQQLGTDGKTAGGAASVAVASLLGALSRNASETKGAEALDRALARDHDGSILNDVGGFLRQAEQGPGDGILRHVLGGRRQVVEAGIGKASGLDAGSAGKLLQMVAPLVLGALGKQRREQNMNSSALAGLLGQERSALEREQPRAMGALGSLLDTDGDGDVDLGDLAKHGAGLLGKFFKR